MPDEMLRMAGRGDDGTAKAIKTDDGGVIYSKPFDRIVVKKDGIMNVAAGGSEYIATGLEMDEDWYSIGLHVGSNISADLTIESRWVSPDFTQIYRVENVFSGAFSTRDVKGRYAVLGKHLTLLLINNGQSTLTIKYTVYGGVN